MNEMYNMSIVTHYYGVIGILGVILVNIWMLHKANNIKDYKRQMSIFTPIFSIPIGIIMFTGVIMMAAKHLEFTIENILMIVFAVGVIVLEVKRAKTLKYLNPQYKGALEEFTTYAMKIFIIEVVLIISISVWMWI